MLLYFTALLLYLSALEIVPEEEIPQCPTSYRVANQGAEVLNAEAKAKSLRLMEAVMKASQPGADE